MNELLNYLEYFCYDINDEAVHILPGNGSGKARMIYDNAVKSLPDDENSRWYFDIALDCLKQFDKEFLNSFIEKKEIDGYHFTVGLFVRNNYVYESKLHHCKTADDASAAVYEYMKCMVMPDFVFNK